MDTLSIALIGLLAGVVGTSLGGLLVLALGKPRPEVISGVLGFAGGIMVSVVFADLLPEALEVGGLAPAALGVILGIAFIVGMDRILPHAHPADVQDANSRFIRAGMILCLGVGLHNLPEGIAIGTGYAADPRLGLTLALLIGAHNIPEGMALSVPLLAGGLRGLRILFIAAIAGVPLGLGAYIGAAVGNISELSLSVGLGFAAGAMLYMVFHELIPGAHRIHPGHVATVGTMVGVLVGLLLSALL